MAAADITPSWAQAPIGVTVSYTVRQAIAKIRREAPELACAIEGAACDYCGSSPGELCIERVRFAKVARYHRCRELAGELEMTGGLWQAWAAGKDPVFEGTEEQVRGYITRIGVDLRIRSSDGREFEYDSLRGEWAQG
jgi:hypothetical protein